RAAPYLDPDMDRLVDTGLKEAAGRAGFLCIRQRFPELAEDLVFPHDHRIDTGCKGEEVAQGPGPIVDEIVLPPIPVEEVAEGCLVSLDHHFHPVAGLEEEDAGKAFPCRGQEFFFAREPERFYGRDICRVMADPGNSQWHERLIHAGISSVHRPRPGRDHPAAPPRRYDPPARPREWQSAGPGRAHVP